MDILLSVAHITNCSRKTGFTLGCIISSFLLSHRWPRQRACFHKYTSQAAMTGSTIHPLVERKASSIMRYIEMQEIATFPSWRLASLAHNVGNTEMLPIDLETRKKRHHVHLKLEGMNPTGSMKD